MGFIRERKLKNGSTRFQAEIRLKVNRLEVGNKEFMIDILLYHRKLKSLVAIELKVGEFLPEFMGKMQIYLTVLDDKVRVNYPLLKEEAWKEINKLG